MDNATTHRWELSWQNGLPRLRTDRLFLRLCTAAEAPLVVRYLLKNRDRLERWESIRTEEHYQVDTWIRGLREETEHARRGDAYRFRLFYPGQEHDALGVVSLRNITLGATYAAEIGYSIDADAEGQGLMQEATEAVIRYAFDYLNLHRLEAICMPGNARSRQLLGRLGFEQEGVLRGVLRIQGEWEDHLLFARINERWQAPRANP